MKTVTNQDPVLLTLSIKNSQNPDNMDIKDMAADPTLNDPNAGTNYADTGRRVIIKAIGVGGGGNNAVDHMYKQGIEDVSFVVCNTDLQALKKSPVKKQVLLGPNVTFGLGAGNDPVKACKAAEESAADINALFDDDTKMVFITAGMGGGTGTGAGPVVARLAKERGLLTIGIVTIPFLFEGEKKIKKALDGADEMAKYVDALLVINNERLTEIYPDLDFINAFRKADDTLTTAARSIAEIITTEGHINLDFNDVDTTLRNGGAAIISTGYGEGEYRVTAAINDALNSPLLKNRDIYGSKRLLFNIYFNPNAKDSFKMEETDELTEFMGRLDPSVDVIWGVGMDETIGEKIKITILAAGFDVTIREEENVLQAGRQPLSIHVPGKRQRPATAESDNKRIGVEYGEDKLDRIRLGAVRDKYVILAPDQLDDDDVIDTLEQTPTFSRDKKVSDSLRTDRRPEPKTPAPDPDASVIDFS